MINSSTSREVECLFMCTLQAAVGCKLLILESIPASTTLFLKLKLLHPARVRTGLDMKVKFMKPHVYPFKETFKV